MIAVVEAQRSEFPEAIGGFCQLTSLTQHDVTQRILRRLERMITTRRAGLFSRTWQAEPSRRSDRHRTVGTCADPWHGLACRGRTRP
jgi:hypothetical protein